MKNTLADLNNYLFEQIERLNDDEATEEQLERSAEQAEAEERGSRSDGYRHRLGEAETGGEESKEEKMRWKD